MRAWWATHSLSRRCLVAWLLLLPLVVLVQPLDGRWAVVRDMVNALGGSFLAVVVGALFVERWREELVARSMQDRRDIWLHANAPPIEHAHKQIFADLADIAVAAYSATTPLLPPREHIPENPVRWDLTARPRSYTGSPLEALAYIDERMRLSVNGPLVWAIAQADGLYEAAVWSHLDADARVNAVALRRAAALEGDDHLTASLRRGAEEFAAAEERPLCTSVFEVAPEDLVAFVTGWAWVADVWPQADLVADNLRDLATLDVFRPLNESAEGAGETMALLAAGRTLRRTAAQARDLAAELASAGEPAGVLDDLAVELLRCSHELLDAVDGTRHALLRQVRLVSSTAASTAIDSRVVEIAREAVDNLRHFSEAQSSEEWGGGSPSRTCPPGRAAPGVPALRLVAPVRTNSGLPGVQAPWLAESRERNLLATQSHGLVRCMTRQPGLGSVSSR